MHFDGLRLRLTSSNSGSRLLCNMWSCRDVEIKMSGRQLQTTFNLLDSGGIILSALVIEKQLEHFFA